MRIAGLTRLRVVALSLACLLAVSAVGCSDDDAENNVPAESRTPEPAIGTGPPVADVSVGAAIVAPGGEVTVNLVVTPQEGVTVGALDISIKYDTSVVRATACAPEGCNPTYGPDTAHFSMASLEGFSGPSATLTLLATGSGGAASALDVTLETCASVDTDIISCSATDGSVTIGG